MRCTDCRQTEAARASLLDRPISRRSLVKLGLATTLSVYAARMTPLAETLAAAQAAPGGPVLVSVFVPGGLDLMDTLVPVGSYGRYADLRPSVRVRSPIPLPGLSGIAGHPALATGPAGGLAGLLATGRLGLLPGIDYAGPDLSHFTSRHFWETGMRATGGNAGWLARWVDRHGNPDNPFQALSISGSLSPVLRGSANPVAAVDAAAEAGWWTPGVWGEWEGKLGQHLDALAGARPAVPGRAAVHAALRQTRTVATTLRPFEPRREDGVVVSDPLAGPVPYPEGDLADRLKTLAALLSLPLGVRVATVDDDGDFDTHDDQAGTLARDLAATSAALSTFQTDLEARGIADRVLTLVWTEFGRRAKENASGGTDHGAGGLAFVMGTRARGGQLSPYPALDRFDRQDNLQVTVDFRTVYASLLEQWMGTAAGDVLPDAGRVGRLQVVR